jgi:hypothetical protein
MGNSEVIVGAAALVTLLGVFVGWYVSKSQHRLSSASFAAEWFRGLRAWASEAVDTLSEAKYESEYESAREGATDEESAAALRRCRHRLSALIDRGRFFLPNMDVDEYGQNKPRAFRGSRHPALSFLVVAERVLGGELGAFKSRHEALEEMQRKFVSYVQGILAPELHNLELARLVRDSSGAREDDPTVGGLLKANPHGASDILRHGPSQRDSGQAGSFGQRNEGH